MNPSFKRNLFILYFLSFLLLIATAIASYSSIINLLRSQDEVAHTNLVISKLEGVISTLKDAETGQRGFLLTGQEDFLEPYNGSLGKAYNLIEDVKRLTSGNNQQQYDINHLKNIVALRMSSLQTLIDGKRKGFNSTIGQLQSGKVYMDSARNIISQMEQREQDALHARSVSLNKFASSTPTFIIIASILSFAVALLSFFRVNNDFDKRNALQNELVKKDTDISRRLKIIQGIAEKISAGDYKTRISDEGQDTLGYLSVSLNKMAESLDTSFTSLSHNEWLQTGIASLNDKMIGEKNLKTLSYNIIEFISGYINAQVAAFYIVNDDKLSLLAGIALDEDNVKKEWIMGEGIAGQSALSKKIIVITEITHTDFLISNTAGKIKPTSIIAVPVLYEGILKGVIELGSHKEFNEITKEFLKNSVYNIGTAIHSAKDNQRLQELLSETQAQKEELQQSNMELEERSRLLEEKNELSIDWFNGRRTPDADQTLKGAITGLGLGSDAPHVFRALAEATCFGAKSIVERFIQEGIPVKGLIGIGGVAKKSQAHASVVRM